MNEKEILFKNSCFMFSYFIKKEVIITIIQYKYIKIYSYFHIITSKLKKNSYIKNRIIESNNYNYTRYFFAFLNNIDYLNSVDICFYS